MSLVPNTIFVLGAGFSVTQGYPLARDMKDKICLLKEKRDFNYRGFMQPWDGGYEYKQGRFVAGLKMIDGNEELQFDEILLKLAKRLKWKREDPYLRTNEVLRSGAKYLLWKVHESYKAVKQPYKNFAGQIQKEWQRKGIISFNWDLQAERLLDEGGVPIFSPLGCQILGDKTSYQAALISNTAGA